MRRTRGFESRPLLFFIHFIHNLGSSASSLRRTKESSHSVRAQCRKRLSEAFTANDLRHAATGLAGAWLLTQFASFRTVTMYVEHAPSPESLREIGFSELAKGGNVWLVVPNDESVFEGAAVRSDEWCVHPIQVYLDLKAHPERAKEAAEMLRKQYLDWTADV